ncbi:hypothetical protein C8Q73DRAFT_527248 [Cubamyces lactineus]|nr:hypothetical protein C8Q73DRAFT_527248 [Cubamyces lactineus]
MSRTQHESKAATSAREATYKRMLIDKGTVVFGRHSDWNSRTGAGRILVPTSEKVGPRSYQQQGKIRLDDAPPLEIVRFAHPPKQFNIPRAHVTPHVRTVCPQYDLLPNGLSRTKTSTRAQATPLIVVKEEPREAEFPLDATCADRQSMWRTTLRLLDPIMENAYTKYTSASFKSISSNSSAGVLRVAQPPQRIARYEPYLTAKRAKVHQEQTTRVRDVSPPAHADDPTSKSLHPQATSALRSSFLSVDPPSSPCSLVPDSRPSTACSTPPPVTPPPACHPSLALQGHHVATAPLRTSLSNVTGHPCAQPKPPQLHQLHWVPCIVSPDGTLRRVHDLRLLSSHDQHEHLARYQSINKSSGPPLADRLSGSVTHVRPVQQPMCETEPPTLAHRPGFAAGQEHVSREQLVRPVAHRPLAGGSQVSVNPNLGQPPPPPPHPSQGLSQPTRRALRPNYPRIPRRRLPGLPGELVIIQEYPCSTDSVPSQTSTSSRAAVQPRLATLASKSSM